MASLGWQSEKTLAECMRYMLDNEIATDVCFEVGPEDGPTVEIRAHKFMLISRCPVFEAMMSTEMAETKDEKEAKIRIVDIDEEVFKQLLSFIYCDSVSIDLASAPTLLYSARKYLLPRLTAFCSKYLHSMLQCNNVCEILELSFTYDVEDLKIQCIEFVANNSETVLNDDELLTLSRESFEAIIKVDRMMSGPSTLFNSCVKWAKHQIKIEQSFEAPSDLQIRETLGSFLYEIPFPTISYTEFANLVGESDVLTTDEKSAIYYYLASGKGKLKFNKVSRHERLINLATKITTGFWPQPTCSSCGISKKSPSEITFKTNKDILLTGIGLYKGHDGSDYAIDIQVIKKDYSLPPEKRRCKRIRQISTAPLESQAHSGSTFTIAPLSESSTTFKVSFDEPISIAKGILYTVSAMNYEVSGCCGELCKELIVEDVTFTCVSASPIPSGSLFGNNSASLSSGQSGSISSFGVPANNSTVLTIPHLYFIPM